MPEQYVVRIPFTTTGVVEVVVDADQVSQGDEDVRREEALDIAISRAINETVPVSFEPDGIEHETVTIAQRETP